MKKTNSIAAAAADFQANLTNELGSTIQKSVLFYIDGRDPVGMVSSFEREMIAELLTAECAGEPLAARISIAGIILDCEDSAADAIRALAAEGKFSETDSLGGADRGTKEYRISLDAVDGALAGCRPAGEVREFERVEQRLDLSLDFTGREEQDGDGVRIGSYVFR